VPLVPSVWAPPGPTNFEVERLLAVGVIARGCVAADHQRKIVRAQVILEGGQIDAFLREDLSLDGLHARNPFWRDRTRSDFDRIQFPESATARDQIGADIVGERIGKAPA